MFDSSHNNGGWLLCEALAMRLRAGSGNSGWVKGAWSHSSWVTEGISLSRGGGRDSWGNTVECLSSLSISSITPLTNSSPVHCEC